MKTYWGSGGIAPRVSDLGLNYHNVYETVNMERYMLTLRSFILRPAATETRDVILN